MAAGKLFLCATPIGNLGDMTPRCVEVLQKADLIAVEDTRNSIKLLNHFEIHTPMTAYHEFNRFDKADELVLKMLEGKTVACISDAGMPGISDPGEVLVQKCIDAGIEVSIIPGASAAISALVISGLSTRRFRFEGFLPSDKKERQAVLDEVKDTIATLVFYEAPHRLKETLKTLHEALGDRRIAVCRELTKLHETVERMTLFEAVAYYSAHEARGEFVLVIEGRTGQEKKEKEAEEWRSIPIREHVGLYEARGMDRKEAMKRAATDRGIPKRDVYKAMIEE